MCAGVQRWVQIPQVITSYILVLVQVRVYITQAGTKYVHMCHTYIEVWQKQRTTSEYMAAPLL